LSRISPRAGSPSTSRSQPEWLSPRLDSTAEVEELPR